MIILAIKTDSDIPELTLYDDEKIIDTKTWTAGRMLAKELPKEIQGFLDSNRIESVDGYAGYLGPGSFTGLRIGITTLNALAYIGSRPIVGSSGDDWKASAIKRLQNNENDKILIPEYGGEANITLPKK